MEDLPKFDSSMTMPSVRRDHPPPNLSKKGWHRVRSETELRKEMDALLDKITKVGYENLSNAEKERLLELSSQLSNDGNHLD